MKWLITYEVRTIGREDTTKVNVVSKLTPAAWLVYYLKNFGTNSDVVLLFALEISDSDAKKLEEQL